MLHIDLAIYSLNMSKLYSLALMDQPSQSIKYKWPGKKNKVFTETYECLWLQLRHGSCVLLSWAHCWQIGDYWSSHRSLCIRIFSVTEHPRYWPSLRHWIEACSWTIDVVEKRATSCMPTCKIKQWQFTKNEFFYCTWQRVYKATMN